MKTAPDEKQTHGYLLNLKGLFETYLARIFAVDGIRKYRHIRMEECVRDILYAVIKSYTVALQVLSLCSYMTA